MCCWSPQLKHTHEDSCVFLAEAKCTQTSFGSDKVWRTLVRSHDAVSFAGLSAASMITVVWFKVPVPSDVNHKCTSVLHDWETLFIRASEQMPRAVEAMKRSWKQKISIRMLNSKHVI